MLLQQTKHALGSTALLTIVVNDEAYGQTLLDSLWQLIDDFETRFSRFRVDSELSQFNARAGQFTPISKPFQKLLTAARTKAQDTRGVYNPFILPALQQTGYVGSWPTPQHFDPQLDYRQRRIHSVDTIEFSAHTARIPADAAIDFGGIGKGYLLDELAASIDGAQVMGYWFSLGGDIICEGLDDAQQEWQLSIAAADHPTRSIAGVQNKNGMRVALATSGVTKRGASTGDHAWHHLIDPRTGTSARSDIRTASVVASRAVDADIYASCAVVLGVAEATSFLAERGCAALLQTTIQTPHSQHVHVLGDGITLQRIRSYA
ncbi:MAG TPA: FAD:protein FMN transferase [Candidatus Saccharimonadales bacterium]|nr:FAD:protein FMN transferase [Candidatus Saccharimonadales bacterium]